MNGSNINPIEEPQEMITAPNQVITPTISPAEAMNQARERAKILIDIVKQNRWSTHIGKKDHLHFEAWQTLGRFYDCTTKTTSTKYVEYGNVIGFEAIAVVIDRFGHEIGAAESICMQDEQNWKGKPLYSLKSMAQTRACAKALRQIFGWVAVLAGYSATPAEEMEPASTSLQRGESLPQSTPQSKPTTPSSIQTGRKATPAQTSLIQKLQQEKKIDIGVNAEELSFKEAWELISTHSQK